jgi:hypothetical protein
VKLNLGSGTKRFDDFINVDNNPACNPDIVCDLNLTPWHGTYNALTIEESSVDHVIMHHVLEHLGQTPRDFIAIIKELYRVCSNGAIIDIVVPHPSHDNFFSDPTHVRAVTPTTMGMFDRAQCEEWVRLEAANTPLALIHNVNFKLLRSEYRLDPEADEFLKRSDFGMRELFIKFGRNVIHETWIQMQVVK